MEGIVSIKEAKTIFGKNFIGKEELSKYSDELGIEIPEFVPSIPFERDLLISNSKDFLLILGISTMKGGKDLSLSSLINFFGKSPKNSEPCFYNQDWYLKEGFMQKSLANKWYMIKHSVYESSRAISPEILRTQYQFPSAVQCAFAFFSSWFCRSECLWKNEYIWCYDLDHNGDRIYVGRYIDIDGINNNGFSIHRHLALRNCYCGISVI